MLDAAFGCDEYIGQQGFAGRDQILSLAGATLAGRSGRLLDACCGSGGPAREIARHFGCPVVGLDLAVAGLRLAPRQLLRVAGDAVRLPFRDASFQAALVLDSLASIDTPEVLLAELARVLVDGAGLGFTAEVGRPLASTERARFTHSLPPTVLERGQLQEQLRVAGFEVVDLEDRTPATAAVARRLVSGLVERRTQLVNELGQAALDDLTLTLSTVADLLGSGRVAEVSLVARRQALPPQLTA
jgi:SAM-dependent methyltransferase